VARGLAAGACLVAVGDGTRLTRRLVCEDARLGHGAVTMLVEGGDRSPSAVSAEDAARRAEDAARRAEDAACTAVLSGRTDLVGIPTEPGMAPLFASGGAR
jgi:hypothetical protein